MGDIGWPSVRQTPEIGDYMVTELCPHCNTEITMRWSVEEFGYKAYCPVCRKRLMLCSECQRGEGSKPCDYDSESGSCRFHQGSRRKKHGQHQRQDRQAARVG